MNSFICTLAIFMALMAAVHCNKCKQCWSLNTKECCDEKETDCGTSNCITYSELCTFNGKRYESIRKGCGSEDLCNKLFSISTNIGVTARIHTACCDKDYCNANLNFINGTDPPQNSLRCPSCFDGTSTDECISDKTVNCIQGEGQCVDYRGVVQLSDGSVHKYSLKGCITTGGCDAGFLVLPGTKELKCVKFECTTPATTAA